MGGGNQLPPKKILRVLSLRGGPSSAPSVKTGWLADLKHCKLARRARQVTFQPTTFLHRLSCLSLPISMSVYKIKGLAGATCTRTLTLTLEELGQKYEIDPINLFAGEHKAPEYIQRFQPFGQIPVLIDDDFQLFESRAIIRYLATKHASESLYPTDLKKRALVEQWLSVNQSNEGPVSDIVVEFRVKHLRGQEPDESRVPAFLERLRIFLGILDKQLASTGAYLTGSDFTLADISFLPMLGFALAEAPFANSLDEFPNVDRWWKSASSRQSYKTVTA